MKRDGGFHFENCFLGRSTRPRRGDRRVTRAGTLQRRAMPLRPRTTVRTGGAMARCRLGPYGGLTLFRLFSFLGLPVVLARLGWLALQGERPGPVGVSWGMVRLDVQGLAVVLDRLGEVALLSERQAPAVLGKAIVRLELQSLAVVLDRLREVALLSERQAPVGLGTEIARLELQGPAVVLDCLGKLGALSERNAEVRVSVGRARVYRKGIGPKHLRVMPDVDLVPGENA